jgi:hypothetical protein
MSVKHFSRGQHPDLEPGLTDKRRYATLFHKSLLHADKPLAYFKL